MENLKPNEKAASGEHGDFSGTNVSNNSGSIPNNLQEVKNNHIPRDLPALRLEWALKLAKEGVAIIELQEGSKEPVRGPWAMAKEA